MDLYVSAGFQQRSDNVCVVRLDSPEQGRPKRGRFAYHYGTMLYQELDYRGISRVYCGKERSYDPLGV